MASYEILCTGRLLTGKLDRRTKPPIINETKQLVLKTGLNRRFLVRQNHRFRKSSIVPQGSCLWVIIARTCQWNSFRRVTIKLFEKQVREIPDLLFERYETFPNCFLYQLSKKTGSFFLNSFFRCQTVSLNYLGCRRHFLIKGSFVCFTVL